MVLDEDGNEWIVREVALEGPDGSQMNRLPGHMVFWFGWYSFYPETEVYGINTDE